MAEHPYVVDQITSTNPSRESKHHAPIVSSPRTRSSAPGVLIWISCSELPTAPPTDWGSNFGPGFAVVNGATFADIVPTDLGTIGSGTFSFGQDVNDARWVVGTAQPDGGGTQVAFLKRPDEVMEDLQAGGGSIALAVNNNGQVVGKGGGGLGFLWTDATPPLLVDLEVGLCSTGCTGTAFGLNDRDPAVIVGNVTDPTVGFRAAWWTTMNTTSQNFLDGLGGTANDINNDDDKGRTVGQTTKFSAPRLQAGLWADPGVGEVKVEIHRSGRYKIKVKGIEVDGIDLEFVSFMMHIGDQRQGVGLEFNNRGRCVRANGSPGCGNDDEDEDDDEDDHKKKKRRGRH